MEWMGYEGKSTVKDNPLPEGIKERLSRYAAQGI